MKIHRLYINTTLLRFKAGRGQNWVLTYFSGTLSIILIIIIFFNTSSSSILGCHLTFSASVTQSICGF